MMTILVVMFGLEKVGLHRWLATLLGFIGVLLVVKPTTEGVSAAIIIALISALAVAVRDLLTKRIKDDVPSSIITLGTTIGVAKMGLLLGLGNVIWSWILPNTASPLLFLPWQTLHLQPTMLLLLAAVFVTCGNFAIIMAFRNTDISLISPFRYSVMIWAVVADYLAFDYWPDLWAQIGMILIVISGIYTVRSERQRQDA
jgi:drug/metabolite transporter (DMT)-like permease